MWSERPALPAAIFFTANCACRSCSLCGLPLATFNIKPRLKIIINAAAATIPAAGFPGWEAGLAAGLWALVLPATALALPEAAILARVTRSAVLETLGADYVRTARAKGLAERRVLWRHVLRNALIPMTTILGLQFAFLLAGSIVVENVFALPGLGRLIFQAVSQRDIVVVRDVVMLLVALVVVVNFIIDIAYGLIDPRPRSAA